MAGVLRAEERGPEAFAAAIARARALNIRFDRDVLPMVAAEAMRVPAPSDAPSMTLRRSAARSPDPPTGILLPDRKQIRRRSLM
jgi:hypothetical protein